MAAGPQCRGHLGHHGQVGPAVVEGREHQVITAADVVPGEISGHHLHRGGPVAFDVLVCEGNDLRKVEHHGPEAGDLGAEGDGIEPVPPAQVEQSFATIHVHQGGHLPHHLLHPSAERPLGYTVYPPLVEEVRPPYQVRTRTKVSPEVLPPLHACPGPLQRALLSVRRATDQIGGGHPAVDVISMTVRLQKAHGRQGFAQQYGQTLVHTRFPGHRPGVFRPLEPFEHTFLKGSTQHVHPSQAVHGTLDHAEQLFGLRFRDVQYFIVIQFHTAS
ncbi:MAG: hypothetical protein A4E30_00169 [Methanomassiliicoccales archaeon PtaB.Bin215]|nr:MAG: hypothetical protein A4E30_00169 [Methanomassiliicoccales archaeon PtaB.Bin215]